MRPKKKASRVQQAKGQMRGAAALAPMTSRAHTLLKTEGNRTMTTQQKPAPEPFGPLYPDLGVKVAKLRKGDDVKAYGRAVLDAIKSKQQAECKRVCAPLPKPNCASGTDHTQGAAILKAVYVQNRARATAAPRIWYDANEQLRLYEAAMTAKWAREREL